jgi:hypothetical protein
MFRCTCALLAGLLTAVAASAEGPAGTWRLPVPGQGLTFLLKLEKDGDKWKGSYLGATNARIPPLTVENVTVAGDRVRFALKLQNREFVFDGKVSGSKIPGAFALGGSPQPTTMEASKLKELDAFELAREVVATADGTTLFDSAFTVLSQAAAKKLPEDEVRALVERVSKAAEPYGPFWQRRTAEQLAQSLMNQEGFANLAVSQAQKAERLLDPAIDDAATEVATLQTLVSALKKAKKTEEVAELEARLTKLETKEYEEYVKKAPFEAEKFEGRQGKSQRAVLVELFTGAQCPPCVAADMGFDALEKTYKPTDVVLMQYHLHIPGPDPLTNADSEARAKFYEDDVQGTPSILFDGKGEAGGGGPAAQAKAKYREYRKVIDALVEKQAKAKIDLKATLKDGVVSVTAKASEAEKDGPKVKLRVALIEEVARYAGGNGMKYHHCVVRAFPGGVEGVALKDKSAEVKAELKLDDLRDQLGKYLTTYSAENGANFTDRPMSLKKLRVVAFVQHDTDHDVYQSAQVEVEPAK